MRYRRHCYTRNEVPTKSSKVMFISIYNDHIDVLHDWQDLYDTLELDCNDMHLGKVSENSNVT